MKQLHAVTALTFITIALTGLGCTTATEYWHGNVVKTIDADQTSTLYDLLKTAELDRTLAKGGPYTVFAPSNEAFSALKPGDLQDLQKPHNRDRLVSILTYHVVQGKLLTDNLADKDEVVSMNGDSLDITRQAGQILVDGARIIDPDIQATNGVVHVIDEVLTP